MRCGGSRSDRVGAVLVNEGAIPVGVALRGQKENGVRSEQGPGQYMPWQMVRE